MLSGTIAPFEPRGSAEKRWPVVRCIAKSVVGRTISVRFCLMALSLVLSYVDGSVAQIRVGPPTPFAPAIVLNNSSFVNTYLFPFPTFFTWDKYLQSISGKAVNGAFVTVDSAATIGNIDGVVKALTQSTYFLDLFQYKINTPTFVGSIPTSQKCVDAALAGTIFGRTTFTYGTIESFAACELLANNVRATGVNVFVSPDFDVEGYNGNARLCAQGLASGFHGFQVPPGLVFPVFTVIPLMKGCNTQLDSLTESVSHEMVEAVSDPTGMGFVSPAAAGCSGFLPFGCLTQLYNTGELGDICNGGPANPTKNPGIVSAPFNGATFGSGAVSVAKYWSNSAGACVPQSVTAASTNAASNQEGIACFVFDDGYTNMAGPSDAIFINGKNQACIPDATQGTCRKWFGRGTVYGGRTSVCTIFNDGYANQSSLSDAVFINGIKQACLPDSTSSGTCAKWWGRCEAQ